MTRFVAPLDNQFDINGNPLVGAKREFFVVGEVAQKDTFSDEALTVPNTNPVIANASGVFPNIFLSGDYDVTLKTADDALISGPLTVREFLTGGGTTAIQELTTVTMAANTNKVYAVGDAVETEEATSGNGGGGKYNVVLTATVAPNGRDIIRGTADLSISFVLIIQGVVSVDQLLPNGIDDSLAFQRGFDLVRDTGVKLVGTAGKTYTCLTAMTCLSTNTSPFNYFFDGNLCTFDTSGSGLTTAEWLKVGATTQANAHDKEGMVFENFNIIGNESAISAAPTAPDGTTVGFVLENALNITTKNINIRRCFEGIKTNFCFPLSATSVKVRECYIPFRIDDDSTLATWIDCGATDCRYSGLIQPTTNTKKITNQTFINFRSEGCEAGFYQDPLDGGGIGIESIAFIEPYFENVTNVHMSIGLAFTLSTPATIGADRARSVYNPVIDGGIYSKTADWSATKVPLALPTTATVLGGKFRMGCQISEVVGLLRKYTFQTMMDSRTGDSTDFEIASSTKGLVSFKGASGGIAVRSGNIEKEVEAATGTHNGANNAAVMTDSTASFTVNEHVGKKILNTTDGSLGIITANTATTVTGTLLGGTENDWDTSDAYIIETNAVERTGTGTYTINVIEGYNGGSAMFPTGACDAGTVTVTSTSATVITATCFDRSATPTLFDPTTVRIKVDGVIA